MQTGETAIYDLPTLYAARKTSQGIFCEVFLLIQQPNSPLPNRPHLATEVATIGDTWTVIVSPTFNFAMAASRECCVVLIV